MLFDSIVELSIISSSFRGNSTSVFFRAKCPRVSSLLIQFCSVSCPPFGCCCCWAYQTSFFYIDTFANALFVSLVSWPTVYYWSFQARATCRESDRTIIQPEFHGVGFGRTYFVYNDRLQCVRAPHRYMCSIYGASISMVHPHALHHWADYRTETNHALHK